MREVCAKEVKENFIKEIDERWGLVIAKKKDGSINCCTISWGSIGYIWHKMIMTIYIKPIRFTDEFLKEADCFSVAFFNKDYKKELSLCGVKSGRDINKIKECNFTVSDYNGAVLINEASRVYILKKIYQDQFKKENMIDCEIEKEKYYKTEPMHNIYIGEILKVLEKE